MNPDQVAVQALMTLAVTLPLAAQEAQNPFKPFDHEVFINQAREMGASDAQISEFSSKLEAEPLSQLVDNLLRELSGPYAEAVDQAQRGNPEAALSLAKLCDADQHRVIRVYARYHLGRVFLDADEPEQAAAVFEEFLRTDRNRSPLDAESAFFYATSLADIPSPKQASATFKDFLELFPNAPERFRAVAAQRYAELEAQSESPLHELADIMQSVERELRKTKTGEKTQKQQRQIVTKLQQIIEEIEELERQSSGSPSGNQQSQAPATYSATPTGPARVGSLQNVSGVAERWGDLQERDRKKIEAEVAEKLPPHRRKQLMEYYKKLNRGGR